MACKFTRENIEKLSSRIERQIEWRRGKVVELDAQGHSQPEIASILQVSVGTVNGDLAYLREKAKSNIKRYIDERLESTKRPRYEFHGLLSFIFLASTRI